MSGHKDSHVLVVGSRSMADGSQPSFEYDGARMVGAARDHPEKFAFFGGMMGALTLLCEGAERPAIHEMKEALADSMALDADYASGAVLGLMYSLLEAVAEEWDCEPLAIVQAYAAKVALIGVGVDPNAEPV